MLFIYLLKNNENNALVSANYHQKPNGIRVK